MSKEHINFFHAAAQYFYKKHKEQGGSQQNLAKELGITQSYLSSILCSSRSASLDLQMQIANRLYGPYDKFLVAGRNIIEGRPPHEQEIKKLPGDAETLLAQLTHHIIHKQNIEKDLQDSEQKFKDISLTSGDMIFELDRDLKFTYISGKVKDVIGLTEKEMLGKTIADFVDAAEYERIKSHIEESIKTRTFFDQIIVVRRDGEDYFRHTIAKPVFSEDNTTFLGFRGTHSDITHRKKLENQLDEHKWLLESAVDALENTGVVILDKNNRVLKWNKYYKELMGYPQEILETRDLRKYLEYLQDKLANPEDFFNGIREAQETKEHITHYFKFKDGRTFKRKIKSIFKNSIYAGRIAFLQNVTSDKQTRDTP